MFYKKSNFARLNKCFWIEVDKINNHYNSDHDLEVMGNFSSGGGAGGAGVLRCSVFHFFITV